MISNAELSNAANKAKFLHGGQKYGGKDYYETHIIAVIIKVQEFSANLNLSPTDDARMSMVAALHDTIEDTAYTYELCQEDFGAIVADAVNAISKREGQSHEDYIKAVKQDYYAHKVKIADTLCNLEASIVSQEKWRIKKYTQQLLELTI